MIWIAIILGLISHTMGWIMAVFTEVMFTHSSFKNTIFNRCNDDQSNLTIIQFIYGIPTIIITYFLWPISAIIFLLIYNNSIYKEKN